MLRNQVICDDNDNRRGPYFDPQANHNVPYSPFHPDAAFCGTCHDVSNPVYDTVLDGNGNLLGYAPNDFDTPPVNFSPYAMFPVERTYSEWLMNEYNTPGGIDSSYFGGNKAFVSTCQDCHMKDVTGHGCNKSYAPLRDDLPLHDLTGGNTFIPNLIDSVFPGETNADALAAGILRARDMLQHAATVNLQVDQLNQEVTLKIINETGHKLPSGYPEGRRIWINPKAFNSVTAETFESGHYYPSTGVLDKTGPKIYQIKPGISTGYYQTTSKEFIEFLRDKNVTNDTGDLMYNLWNNNGKSAPEIMNYKTWSGPPVQTTFTLDLKVFLEGPFYGAEMNTTLNDHNLIPVS